MTRIAALHILDYLARFPPGTQTARARRDALRAAVEDPWTVTG